jgi:uncharacterized OsmC-like protein
MGKMHERFKAAQMKITALDVNDLKVEGAKEHFITFAAKGLVSIFARKTSNPVTEELVTPLATLLEAICSIDSEPLSPSGKAAKIQQTLEKTGTELHKVSVKLGIDDSDEAFREYVQKHVHDLVTETEQEVQRFSIEKFAKEFMSTPSTPGATIVASGMGGPMFDGMDMSRFKSK